jgi:hypothetical protein
VTRTVGSGELGIELPVVTANQPHGRTIQGGGLAG